MKICLYELKKALATELSKGDYFKFRGDYYITIVNNHKEVYAIELLLGDIFILNAEQEVEIYGTYRE